MISLLRIYLLLSALLSHSVVVVIGQEQENCTCLNNDNDDDPNNVITLAGIFDLTAYDWGRDIFDVTVQMLNVGHWGILPSPQVRLEHYLRDTHCDEITAIRQYWNVRTVDLNSRPPMGVVGCRCSGASMGLAKVSGLEQVPHVSQASNSVLLSDVEKYPYFSRLVPPSDGRGEVGALAAMMHHFGWERVTTLATDLPYAQDIVTEFRKVWTGTVLDDDDFVRGSSNWKGQVAYSDTIRTTSNGDVDYESLQRALDNIPVNDPTVNSRIIFLAAHTQHAYPILQFATQAGFQPDTIWVWAGREDSSESFDFSWLPDIPGYFGVGPLQNYGPEYTTFLTELQNYQIAHGKEPLQELPTFAAETVDSIRVLTEALVRAPDRRDGNAIVRDLRTMQFSGVSGSVEFTSIGDRKDARFSIYNVQSRGPSDGGSIVWTEIGNTLADMGSVVLNDGIPGACFAEIGCGLTEAPKDRYPDPGPSTKLPAWVIVLIVALVLLVVAFAVKYWRSHRSKKTLKGELEALRDSVVGMRAAECTYMPKAKGDVESGNLPPEAASSGPNWMWQETAGYMDQHDDEEIYGDPDDCWILYPSTSADKLEKAYQKGKPKVSLSDYEVDLNTMVQTKKTTGFARQVQRVVETPSPSQALKDIDMSNIKVGHSVPKDLEDEPQMVLVEGDVVQISKQRDDGWAFGTKLHHADEELARKLVAAAAAATGMSPDDANVFTDTGWFELDNARIPTADDLSALQQNLGDTGVLTPPSHWDGVVNPNVVQQHPLKRTNDERAAVENAFLSTLRPPHFQQSVEVLKVERIQNLAMWQSYVVKRQTLCYRETGQTGGTDDDVQRKAIQRLERRWLFHGSNYETVDKILQQGFNRSFCGKNATAYGKGVYFARDAAYSAHKLYSVPDARGRQYMLACRVVVGEYCRGKMDALTPDVRDNKTHSLYDSTVNDVKNPSIYVTYHDAQAYPEYLITFKTK